MNEHGSNARDGTTGLAVGCLAMAVVVAGVVAWAPAGADARVQVDGLDVEGDTVTVDDTITSFDLGVDGEVAWSGIPDDQVVDHVVVDMYVEGPDGEYERVAHETLMPGSGGAVAFALSGDVLDGTGWTADDFRPENGELERELGVRLDVLVFAEEGQPPTAHRYTTSATDSMTLTVVDGGGGDGGSGGTSSDGGNASVSIDVTASGGADLQGG